MITITIDVDEVLSDTYPLMLSIGTSLGFTHHDTDQYHPRYWFDVDGTLLATVQAAIDVSLADATPLPGARAGVSELASKFTLIALTGRSVERHGASTRTFLERHFPAMFDRVVFADQEGANRSKGEIARSLGAALHIDDLPVYVEDVAAHGLPVVYLHRNRPWQRAVDHPMVFAASNWAAVPGLVDAALPLHPQVYAS